MFRKPLMLTILIVLAMLAALIPLQVRAGGVCGGAYTIDHGDTVDKLSALCGTSPAAIYAANPGLKEPLTVGQTINIPGANYGVPTTVVVTPATPVPATPAAVINNYYTYNYYSYDPATVISSATYTVQPGDTFAGIAYSFGVSINDLWAANPTIVDPNILYVGQILYIPFWYVPVPVPGVGTPTADPQPLSYPGDIPNNAPQGTVQLVNKSNSEVYISLRTSRADGTNAINEFPVGKSLSAEIPVGWIDYVAWVGGVKFTGGFKLRENAIITITFNRSKVVVDG